MLNKGYLTKHKHIYELYILSKYYFHTGLEKEDVKQQVIDFCNKYEEHFSIDEWYKIINNTVNKASKSKFISGKEVSITKKELETIKQLDNLNEQKVAFVMLVLYKFYGFKKFEVSIEDLYKQCKLNLNSKTKLGILHSLTANGLIDIAMGGLRWVKFADKKGKSEIIINDYDNLIYHYLKYIGDKIGVCSNECCKKLYVITGNNHKMCRECWKDYRRNYKTEKQREYRKK